MAAVNPPSATPKPSGPRSPSVMIVDDDSLLLEFVSQTLQAAGFSVTTVEDGEAALYMLPDLELDLIVLDLAMPGMNGLDVLAHIKGNKASAAIPVIILTSSTDAENVRKALNLGAKDYIAKPFEAAKLLARIEKLLGRLEKEKGPSGRMTWEVTTAGFDVPLRRQGKSRIILGPGGGTSDDK